MAKTFRRTSITASTAITATMVRIQWTSAPLVRVAINRDFRLQALRVALLRGEYAVQGATPITVTRGTTLFFVRSGADNGLYYLVSYTNLRAGGFGCSCPSHLGKHAPLYCRHVEAVITHEIAREQARQARIAREESRHLVVVESYAESHPLLEGWDEESDHVGGYVRIGA